MPLKKYWGPKLFWVRTILGRRFGRGYVRVPGVPKYGLPSEIVQY